MLYRALRWSQTGECWSRGGILMSVCNALFLSSNPFSNTIYQSIDLSIYLSIHIISLTHTHIYIYILTFLHPYMFWTKHKHTFLSVYLSMLRSRLCKTWVNHWCAKDRMKWVAARSRRFDLCTFAYLRFSSHILLLSQISVHKTNPSTCRSLMRCASSTSRVKATSSVSSTVWSIYLRVSMAGYLWL